MQKSKKFIKLMLLMKKFLSDFSMSNIVVIECDLGSHLHSLQLNSLYRTD